MATGSARLRQRPASGRSRRPRRRRSVPRHRPGRRRSPGRRATRSRRPPSRADLHARRPSRRFQRGAQGARARRGRRPSDPPPLRRCRRSRPAAPRWFPRTTGPWPCTGRHARRSRPGARQSRTTPPRSRRRHRQDPRDGAGVVPAESAEAAPELEPGDGVAEAGRLDVGRGPRRRARRGSRPSERTSRSNPAYASASAPTPARRAFGRPGHVGPQGDRASVGPRREDPNVRGDEATGRGAQAQLAHDRRPQPADRVGQGRDAGARRQLGGRRRSADGLAPLQDDRPQAGPRQVGGGDQAVVAAADRRSRRRSSRVRAVRPPCGRGPGAPRAPRSGRWRP